MHAEGPVETRRRRARLEAGFDNVEALAVAAGVSHNTVRAYERGQRVRATTQRQIEEAIKRRAQHGRATLDDVIEAVQALRTEVRALRAELDRTNGSEDQPTWPRL
jgi:transcriptional regulator with XRE-family HTH domain